MLTRWVKDLNPKAKIIHADRRCGNLVAVATPSENGLKVWSQFMRLTELEKCLVMYFDNNFSNIKNA